MEISSSNLPKNSIDIAFLDLRAWQPPRQRCMGRFAVAEIPAVTKKKNASGTGFRVENAKKNGTPGEIRTHDLLLRRQTLYPAELRVHREYY